MAIIELLKKKIFVDARYTVKHVCEKSCQNRVKNIRRDWIRGKRALKKGSLNIKRTDENNSTIIALITTVNSNDLHIS